MKTIQVVAAVIVKDNKVFATQRGYGDYKDWWEFPGGKIEPGETPQEALTREINEELDTDISVGDFLVSTEYEYPEFHLSMDCYLCDVVRGDLTLLEHEAARWLPVDDHDLEVLDKEVEEIVRLTSGTGFTLAAFKVDDWNDDLSPWKAAAVFGDHDFGAAQKLHSAM